MKPLLIRAFGMSGFLAGIMIIPMTPAILVLNDVSHMVWLGTFKVLLILFFVGLGSYLACNERFFAPTASVLMIVGASLVLFNFFYVSSVRGMVKAGSIVFKDVHEYLHGPADLIYDQTVVLASYVFQASDFLVGVSFLLMGLSLLRTKSFHWLPTLLGLVGGLLLMSIETVFPLTHQIHEVKFNVLIPFLGAFLIYGGLRLLRSYTS